MAATVAQRRGGGRSPSLASVRPPGHGGFYLGGDDDSGIPRSSFMQVPLAVQSDQLARGRKVFEELSSFARDRQQVEEKIAHGILRTSRSGAADHEISGGSLQRGLLALRRFCALESRQHSVLARQMQEQFYQPLEQAMSRHADFVMRAKLAVQRSAQLVQESEGKLSKAKRQLSKTQNDEKGQREALARARQDPRASQKDVDWVASKAGRAVESTRQAEANALNERHLLLQALRARDEAVAGAARHFEMAERDRATNVARAIAGFASRQGDFYASQVKNLETLSQAVENLDPDGDVDSFIERRRHPEHAPLYGVALSLLDWARVEPVDAAKSKTQQQQQQQHSQQEGTAGDSSDAAVVEAIPAAATVRAGNVAEDAAAAAAAPAGGQDLKNVRQSDGTETQQTSVAIGVPIATVVPGTVPTKSPTSPTVEKGKSAVEHPSARQVEDADDSRGIVAHERVEQESPAAEVHGAKHVEMDSKNAIERYLRKLIPDQQQAAKSSRPPAPVKPGMVSHDPLVSKTETPTLGSANPFDPDFVGPESTSAISAAASSAATNDDGGEGGAAAPERPSPVLASSEESDSDVNGKEALLSRSGDEGAEEARRELGVLVQSERGRGNFLQALNERRSEATEVTPEAFDVLVETLRVFLDGCEPGMRDRRPLSPLQSIGSPVGAFVGPGARKTHQGKGTPEGAAAVGDETESTASRARTLSAPSPLPASTTTSPLMTLASTRTPMSSGTSRQLSPLTETLTGTRASGAPGATAHYSARNRIRSPTNVRPSGSSPPPNPAALQPSAHHTQRQQPHHPRSTQQHSPTHEQQQPQPQPQQHQQVLPNTPQAFVSRAPDQRPFSTPSSSSARPQSVNLLELAASVVGIRNSVSNLGGGSGSGGSAGSAGFNTSNGDFNGSASPSSGIKTAGLHGSGAVGGGLRAGGAEQQQQRGNRWGFGGSREAVSVVSGVDRMIAMNETVEAALGRGRFGGARQGGISGMGNGAVIGAGTGVGKGEMDIRSARQAMILANTFFKTVGTEDGGDAHASGGVSGRPARRYLLKDLRNHSLWKYPRFWDEALMLGVKEQLQEGPAVTRWDDLQGEARREAVSRTHNVVFSQLASIAFNMLECGVSGARVRTEVTRKCRESQLGEAQVQELLRDLDNRIRRRSATESDSTADTHVSPPKAPKAWTASPAEDATLEVNISTESTNAMENDTVRVANSSSKLSPELAFLMEASQAIRRQPQSTFGSRRYQVHGDGSVAAIQDKREKSDSKPVEAGDVVHVGDSTQSTMRDEAEGGQGDGGPEVVTGDDEYDML